MVLCLVKEEPHCVLDIGTSEGGIARGGHPDTSKRTVTKTGNLQYRLKKHDRRNCWEENSHGEIGYCARYVADTMKRNDLERELQWKIEYACGTNPWKETEKRWKEYQQFEEKFGPMGSWSKNVLGYG